MSVSANAAPGARVGAGGFIVTTVGARFASVATACTVAVAVTSPPFPDPARARNVSGPAVLAWNVHVAERPSMGTRLPSVTPSRGAQFMTTPSCRVVLPLTGVTPSGSAVSSTWTPDVT